MSQWHGACPQVVDGRDSFQIWKVGVNVLNEQLQTADKGWSLAWKLAIRLATHHKKPACYRGHWTWQVLAKMLMDLWIL
jgi:hypothetical protein